MKLKQLKIEIDKAIANGQEDSEVFVQHSDKSNFPNGEYQLPIRINHYDDGIAIIVE